MTHETMNVVKFKHTITAGEKDGNPHNIDFPARTYAKDKLKARVDIRTTGVSIGNVGVYHVNMDGYAFLLEALVAVAANTTKTYECKSGNIRVRLEGCTQDGIIYVTAYHNDDTDVSDAYTVIA